MERLARRALRCRRYQRVRPHLCSGVALEKSMRRRNPRGVSLARAARSFKRARNLLREIVGVAGATGTGAGVAGLATTAATFDGTAAEATLAVPLGGFSRSARPWWAWPPRGPAAGSRAEGTRNVAPKSDGATLGRLAVSDALAASTRALLGESVTAGARTGAGPATTGVSVSAGVCAASGSLRLWSRNRVSP